MNTARSLPPEPPARGSFPLDHGGQCKAEMLAFAACIRLHESAHHPCRDLSRSYLECRMQRGLMAPEDLNSLGFDPSVTVVPGLDRAPAAGEIVAGLTAARKSKPAAMFGISLPSK